VLKLRVQRVSDLGAAPMFRNAVFDPVPFAMMGFGILLAAALAFVI
jgi:hypothetical protein